jgi:hypothetical protein
MEYFIGEVGKAISLNCGFDLTSVSTKTVYIIRPSSPTSTLTFTGTDVVVDDTGTGQIHVLSKSGDLSVAGTYLAQAKMVWANGDTKYSPIAAFNVDGVLA